MRVPASRALVLTLLAAGSAWAQAEAPLRLQARLGAGLTVSDQIDVLPGGSDGGAVFTLSPGFRLSTGGAQLRGHFDYGLDLLAPWRIERRPDEVQQTLRAGLEFRPQDSGFSLSSDARIGQQVQSAFGAQRGSDGSLSTSRDNRAEVYGLSVAPSFKMRLGSLAELSLSHRVAATNTKGSAVGDSIARSSGLQLAPTERGSLGWALRLSSSETRPKQSRRTRTHSAQASLRWSPDIDWELGVGAGRERSNLRGSTDETGTTYSAQLSWRPGPRTRLAVSGDQRVFARTYNLSFDHRFSRATLRASESRMLTEPGVVGSGAARTFYDLLFAQLASVEPDPTLREALVLSQLQQLGLSPDAVATSGFISGRPSLTRQSLIAGTWKASRSVWSLTASRSRSQRFGGPLDGLIDDFSTSSLLDTLGATFNMSYRLTPAAGLNFGLRWQRNDGDRASLRTELRSATLGWSSQLGPRQQVGVNLRHSVFDSLIRPYDENALVLSFQHQF